MGKLVLQEIWSDLSYTKIKKPYNYMIAIAVFLLWILLFSFALTDRNIFVIAAFIVIFSNYMLKGDISDCIYIIPGSIRDYIKARYRLTVLIELLMYMVLEIIGCIIYIISDEKVSYSFALENFLITAAFILYVLIKNTWLLYVNFGLKEIQTYKCAQGLSLFWLFCIDVIGEIAEEKTTSIVPLLIELAAVGGFIAYAVYICMYVKKYLIIKTYK